MASFLKPAVVCVPIRSEEAFFGYAITIKAAVGLTPIIQAAEVCMPMA